MSKSSGPLTTYSEAQTLAGHTVVMEARAWRFRLPFFGVVWNRPTAVLAGDEPDRKRLPIRDVTRRAQVIVLALAAACFVAGLSRRTVK